MDGFVNLHCHQQYSLQDGVGTAKQWAERIDELKQSALALTDHGTLAGTIAHYKACKEIGINPIIGQESYVVKDRFVKEKTTGRRDYVHVTMLARTNEGLSKLIQLSSSSWVEGFYYRPRMDWKQLKGLGYDIIFMSACMSGPISRLLLDSSYDEAKKKAIKLHEYLGNFYLEIMPVNLEGQKKVNEGLIKISREAKIPLVLTNDCHYPCEGGEKMQDVLLLLQYRKTLKDREEVCYKERKLYPKSLQDIMLTFCEYFPDTYRNYKKYIYKAAENTLLIADSCDVEIPLGIPEMPNYGVEDSSKLLFEKIKVGFKNKVLNVAGSCDRDGYYIDKKKYTEQVMREYALISKMNLCDYFLLIADLISNAKKKKIRTGGARGSVAGSLVAYCLDITDVDPIKFGLLFERFLSEGRKGVGNIPDIDMDFQHDRRDEVKQYLVDRWGANRVVNVSAYGTMGSKSIVKDVARVYGIDHREINNITRELPDGVSIEDALKTSTEFSRFAMQHKGLIRVAEGLEGQVRHLSTHAAGVVVFNGDASKVCPLCINTRTREVLTQWNMYDISDRGFLKLDILGLKTLTVLDKCVKHINKDRNKDSKFKLENIKLTNKAVYKEFQYGNTVGVFQFENYGFQDLCKRVKPKSINDLAIINALGRPGAKQTGQDLIYLENKKRNSFGNIKKILANIIGSTYGAIIFQEQVMEICHKIGGLSLAQTNEVRESIKHFKHDVMASFERKFIKGAIKNGYARDGARELWELIKVHSSYSFNKNHSVAYSIVSYQTMYMKVAYPDIYMLHLLRSVEGDQYKTRNYIVEARSLGIQILPPDLYKSGIGYRLHRENRKSQILLGFTSIKGIGIKRAEQILKLRKQFGKDYVDNLPGGITNALKTGEIKS